jgi:two-component system, OmpR family, sensor kinase
MAGSSLRPIVRTTKAVQAIGDSQRLDQRVEYNGPADEIGDLVYTFNRMLDRLESTISAQRRFVADASHELRTPLTTLRLNVELLRRDRSAESAERGEVLDDVATELDRISRLVQGLLDLARADAGMHLEKQPIRADEVIRDVYHQVRPAANGVAIAVGDLVPTTLNANPDYVKQMLLTLADNAIKYTPTGGRVRIDLERDGHWVKFVVSDTGGGIDAHLRALLPSARGATPARHRPRPRRCPVDRQRTRWPHRRPERAGSRLGVHRLAPGFLVSHSS